MNKVFLLGNVTKDIEIKEAGETKVANFDIAVPRQKKGEVDFVKCVAFNKTAEVIAQYFGKGRQILVTGHLTVDNYTDNDGNKRTATKVIVETFDFLNGGKKDETTSTINVEEIQKTTFTEEMSDDLPF